MESKYTKHNPGGESSADYIISESGEEQQLSTQSRKGKKERIGICY
jgi:hypothetical protein